MFTYGCEQSLSNKSINKEILFEKKFKNIGFALIYNESGNKIKNFDQRSLNIYHKSLKKKSMVKITNPENGKSLIAEVKSNRIKFSEFYNSIITERIVEAPIYEKNLNFEIELKSTYPGPTSLNSMSWEGEYSTKHHKRV